MAAEEINDSVSPVAMNMAAARPKADLPLSELPMAQNWSNNCKNG